MPNYEIKYTDSQEGFIPVPEAGMNKDFDVIFPGRVRLEWGEEINEAFLNLMENFACPANPSNINEPDTTQSSVRNDVDNENKLSNPVKGQLWYNKTNDRLYHYNGTSWEPYTLSNQDYGANWGQINSGQPLPQPQSSNGYVFDYDECIWSVSPFQYLTVFDRMTCETDLSTSVVTMTYRSAVDGTTIQGIANYLIIGIKDNVNNGIDELT